MPLGKLSKSQIAKGFEVIEEIEAAVKSGSNQTRLEDLSSRFFTIIPHNFGRNRPPVIRDAEVIEKKKEMLLVRWSSATFCLSRATCLVVQFVKISWYACPLSPVTLQVLADIEVAQSLQADSVKPQEVETVPHPLDKDYQSLMCNLTSLGSQTEEYKVELGVVIYRSKCVVHVHECISAAVSVELQEVIGLHVLYMLSQSLLL